MENPEGHDEQASHKPAAPLLSTGALPSEFSGQDVVRAHRAGVALRYGEPAAAFGERIQFPQHQRMGEAEMAGEGAAVMGYAERRGGEKCRLDRAQLLVLRLQPGDERQEALRIRHRVGHAASRLRKVTMIDLEVGVSLSSPALPSGTSTFSSG